MNERGHKRKIYFDYSLLVIVLFLLAFGLVMVYSTSSYSGSINLGDGRYYLKKQLSADLIGLAVMIVTIFIPYQFYKKLVIIIYPVGVLSIFSVLTPLGYSANGATRWIRIAGVSLQPAEITKAAIIITMAFLISSFEERHLKSWKAVLFVFTLAAIPSAFIYKITDNLSSAIIVAGIAFLMYAVASRRNKWLVILFAAAVLVATLVVVYTEVNKDPARSGNYREKRIEAWLHTEENADESAYQTVQSLYSIGSGGIFGKGLGKSMQKLGFLPEAQNDMIFSIICEELGIMGGIATMLSFLLLLWRIRDASVYTNDPFAILLVTGVFAHIFIQVFLNIAVVTNTIPNTGISLPFISYGGSSVVFTLAEIGIVLNVGMHSKITAKPVVNDSNIVKFPEEDYHEE